MKTFQVILLLLAASTSTDVNYFLTTQKEVNNRKVEMLKEYTRSTKTKDRLMLYTQWFDSDIRFRKTIAIGSVIKTAGFIEKNVITDKQIESIEKEIYKSVDKKMTETGFKISVTDDLNIMNITVWVIKIRESDDMYIIDAQLRYTRDLKDLRTDKSIQATIYETMSFDYTRDKSQIETIVKVLSMRSLDAFIKQMQEDETNMQVYYELLADGLISKYPSSNN